LLSLTKSRGFASRRSADIARVKAPEGVAQGPATADYRFSFRDAGKTAECKDLRASSLKSLQKKLTASQSPNVVGVVKKGQITPEELGKIPGRVMGPNSPSQSIQYVTIVEESDAGFAVRLSGQKSEYFMSRRVAVLIGNKDNRPLDGEGMRRLNRRFPDYIAASKMLRIYKYGLGESAMEATCGSWDRSLVVVLEESAESTY
jgi:hypothetical protein